MKISEEKLIQKIKELAENIIESYPENSDARSIISLCEIVECDKIDKTTYRHTPQSIIPEVSFESAIQEQHS